MYQNTLVRRLAIILCSVVALQLGACANSTRVNGLDANSKSTTSYIGKSFAFNQPIQPDFKKTVYVPAKSVPIWVYIAFGAIGGSLWEEHASSKETGTANHLLKNNIVIDPAVLINSHFQSFLKNSFQINVDDTNASVKQADYLFDVTTESWGYRNESRDSSDYYIDWIGRIKILKVSDNQIVQDLTCKPEKKTKPLNGLSAQAISDRLLTYAEDCIKLAKISIFNVTEMEAAASSNLKKIVKEKEIIVKHQSSNSPGSKIPQYGTQSYTLEKIAAQQGCKSEQGAELLRDDGPIERYKITCQNGKTVYAYCEYRECRLSEWQ